VQAWTSQSSAPVAVWNDERPRSTWSEQLYLVERLEPEPALIPTNIEDRALMFGYCMNSVGRMALVGHDGSWCSTRPWQIRRVTTLRARLRPTWVENMDMASLLLKPPGASSLRFCGCLTPSWRNKHALARSFRWRSHVALDIYWSTFAVISNRCRQSCALSLSRSACHSRTSIRYSCAATPA